MQPLRADMFAPECPSSVCPIKVGDKWAAGVILCLDDGPRRFSELRVPLRATAKVLTETLRALERDGMVTRTAYPEIPPRVEYELTDMGRSLLEILAGARRWAERYVPQIRSARAEYDAEGAVVRRDAE